MNSAKAVYKIAKKDLFNKVSLNKVKKVAEVFRKALPDLKKNFETELIVK